MSRRVVALTVDRLTELDGPVRESLFWELDPVRRRAVPQDRRAAEKEAWVSEVLRDWGSCGRVVCVDGRPVGIAIYVPEAYAPGAAAYPTAPISPDALLLTTVWVDPAYRGAGLGRMLIQGMARDLVSRGGIGAVEAYADRGPLSAVAGERCAPPEGFLAHVGFRTRRSHPAAPRLRMELRSTVRWRDEVEAAVGRLMGAVRPAHKPVPAPRGPLTRVRLRRHGHGS